jgi:hypothetical protein
MKRPTPEEQKRLVKQWEITGPLLERIRREELRDKPFDWREVDDLLSLADQTAVPERTTSGLVEQQRIFMRGRPREPVRKGRD